MDIQKYKIRGIVFEIILNSDKYKISDLFNEPQPYNLYINYHIIKCKKDDITNEKIIINDNDNTSVKIEEGNFIIETNISKLVQKNYNQQFSLFGNKGIVQKYILCILEKKYNSIVFHGCALKNEQDEIIIGLGESGSGKSVLINLALQKGWKLISTEQTIINKDMYIYKGNIFDNVSPLSEESIRKKLPKAIILSEKRLIEPIGQKIFVDMSSYQMKNDTIKMDLNKLTIINVDFKGKNENIVNIEDKDYLLRLLQISASEKISFPAIIRNSLIDYSYIGNSKIKNYIINNLINSNTKKIILSNGFTGFNSYFEKKGSKNAKKISI